MPKVFDYRDACRRAEAARPAHPHVPGVFVGWDNTCRRGKRAIVLTGSTPENFGEALRKALLAVVPKAPEDRIVMINAWNEWAEGMYLEPDRRWGLGYLEALRHEVAEFAAQYPDVSRGSGSPQ